MHQARKTVDLLTKETPDFIPPTLWPPNSLDLNPVDYKVWSVMHEVYIGNGLRMSTNCVRVSWQHATNLTSVLLIRQLDSGAPVCARVSSRKTGILNTNLADSFIPLLVGQSYLF